MRRALSSLRFKVSVFFNDVLYRWSWGLVLFILRVLFGFHVEGGENQPEDAPFIIVINEHSLIATVVGGWISVSSILRVYRKHHNPQDTMIGYAQELLWTLPFFRNTNSDKARSVQMPLMPHSAGRLALNLVAGLKALRANGLVTMNPEGDMTWDGRTITTGTGAAWLALHTGVPIAPYICSADAYDIWPRWRRGPAASGRLALRIGKPFKLADGPISHVTAEQVRLGTERIHEEMARLRFGPGGVEGWAGSHLRNGAPLRGPIPLPPSSPVPTHAMNPDPRLVPVGKRDVAQLLWRCPVCGTDDALLYQHPRFQPETARCQACDTAWAMRRVKSHDFRFKLVSGPAELTGLDLPLSAWYDQMKRQFQPVPMEAPGFSLSPGERVYLVAGDAELAPHAPNALLDGWTEREAPTTQPPGAPQLGVWTGIGKGRLLMTDQRILWQGRQREVEFRWPGVRAVHIWNNDVLGLNYGNAGYRLSLGNENALKWLTYAGRIVEPMAASLGCKVGLSAH